MGFPWGPPPRQHVLEPNFALRLPRFESTLPGYGLDPEAPSFHPDGRVPHARPMSGRAASSPRPERSETRV